MPWTHTPRSQREFLYPGMDETLLTRIRANGNFDLFDDDPRTDDRRNNASFAEASDFIVDIREYDVPYHVRVMIDLGISIRCAYESQTDM